MELIHPSLRPENAAAPDLENALATIEKLGQRLRAVIVGRDEVIELVLIALLADGHVLLEDYPGSGKTTLARALGDSLLEEPSRSAIATFRRIQFTPDLLPSDVTGSSVFEPDTNRFSFRRGPLFAHVVLADEINRTSPKVQSAMLEAMAEKQVTADNCTYPLDELFFVIATQNPRDIAGTYPLPKPQLDRFLFKIPMRYIDRQAELGVLAHYPVPSLQMSDALPKVKRDDILAARRTIRRGVYVAEPIREALVDVAGALRTDTRVLQAASTRSLVLMLPALQTRALMRGRAYVAPEDLGALAGPVFRHRVECSPSVPDCGTVIASCLAPQLERLARYSLKR
jgi:MoxR-like ATPase